MHGMEADNVIFDDPMNMGWIYSVHLTSAVIGIHESYSIYMKHYSISYPTRKFEVIYKDRIDGDTGLYDDIYPPDAAQCHSFVMVQCTEFGRNPKIYALISDENAYAATKSMPLTNGRVDRFDLSSREISMVVRKFKAELEYMDSISVDVGGIIMPSDYFKQPADIVGIRSRLIEDLGMMHTSIRKQK